MMTAIRKQQEQHTAPSEPDDSPPSRPRPGVPLQGRPRSVDGEEAYLRSAMERAEIDIAAGW